MDLTTRMDRLICRDILLHITFLTGEELKKTIEIYCPTDKSQYIHINRGNTATIIKVKSY